jgi:hypothetical protein
MIGKQVPEALARDIASLLNWMGDHGGGRYYPDMECRSSQCPSCEATRLKDWLKSCPTESLLIETTQAKPAPSKQAEASSHE